MQDCTWHGSAEDSQEMKEIIKKEMDEEGVMGVWKAQEDSTPEHPKGVLTITWVRAPSERREPRERKG